MTGFDVTWLYSARASKGPNTVSTTNFQQSRHFALLHLSLVAWRLVTWLGPASTRRPFTSTASAGASRFKHVATGSSCGAEAGGSGARKRGPRQHRARTAWSRQPPSLDAEENTPSAEGLRIGGATPTRSVSTGMPATRKQAWANRQLSVHSPQKRRQSKHSQRYLRPSEKCARVANLSML